MTVGSLSVARAGLPPALAARLVLGAAVLAHLVVVEVLFASAGTGKNSVLTVAKFFGLHAASIMMLQLVLVARLPWLDRRIGMDRLTVWHRWIGFTLVWTVLTHATLVVLGYAWLDSLRCCGRSWGWPALSRRCSGCAPPPSSSRSRRSPCGTPAGGCRTRPGTPSTSASTSRSCSHSCTRAWKAPRSRLTGRARVLVDDVDAGPARIRGGPDRHADLAQRLPPVPGRRGRPGIRQRRVRLRHRAPPRSPSGPGRASSSSGGSPGTTAGGRRTRSPCRPRRTGGRCVSPPRPSARRAPGCATSRSAPARSLEGPYGAFTALHQTRNAILLDRRRRGDHPDPRPARGVDGSGRRPLPGAHHGRRRAARPNCRSWPAGAARRCTC